MTSFGFFELNAFVGITANTSVHLKLVATWAWTSHFDCSSTSFATLILDGVFETEMGLVGALARQRDEREPCLCCCLKSEVACTHFPWLEHG